MARKQRVMRGRHLAAAIAATALMLSACAAASAAENETWRHGIVAAKSDSGFAMMAVAHGFAAQQGITIKTLQLNGDALLLKALLAGEIDSYDGSPGSPLIAASHGADIKLVGCYWPVLTYALFSKPTVTLDHLAGKTFGISSPGALPDLLARATLEKYSVPSTAARFVVMGSDSERFQALVAGVIDVAAISIEFAPVAAQQKLKLLAPAREIVPNYLRFCTYMTSKTIATRRDAAIRFLAAEMSAYRYALSHRDAEIALARQTIHAKPDDPRPAYVFDEVVRSHAIDPAMPIPLDKLAWMQDLLIKTGNLQHRVDLSKFIDDSLRVKALALAGH